jgi:hypothetical protein
LGIQRSRGLSAPPSSSRSFTRIHHGPGTKFLILLQAEKFKPVRSLTAVALEGSFLYPENQLFEGPGGNGGHARREAANPIHLSKIQAWTLEGEQDQEFSAKHPAPREPSRGWKGFLKISAFTPNNDDQYQI